MNEMTNEQRSKQEQDTFLSSSPEKYVLYIRRVDLQGNPRPDSLRIQATTWMGDILGTGVLGPSYKCPAFYHPSTRRSVTFTTVKGLVYHGTYFESSGDYARVRLSAQSKRRLASNKV